MKKRVYVCHTFYHVYVTLLKELNREERGKGATLVISHMSNDFKGFPERIRSFSFFDEVVEFDEKPETFFPQLARYRVKESNFVKSTLNRIQFTRKFAKLEAAYIPVDFKQFEDIYVFCDSDPIGYYLNQYRIPYHALEDGLNCLKNGDLAHLDNVNHFGIKAFLSEKCNLIFIQNGYGKYCLDMEVNDASIIDIPYRKYKSVSRNKLVEALTGKDKELLLNIFVSDIGSLKRMLSDVNQKTALILTEPLCTLDVRQRIFEDICRQYKEYQIVIKPHPRDELDYNALFPNHVVLDKTVPMEMLNFLENCSFDLVVGVFTELGAIDYAKEKVRLGADFMDQYEDPSIHRFPDLKKG